DTFNRAWVEENLGLLLFRSGQKEKGLEILNHSLELFEKYNAKVRVGAVRFSLYELYRDLGEEEKALAMLEQYTELKDSLRSVEIEKNIAELEVQYETEKKEQALRIGELELSQKTQERNI